MGMRMILPIQSVLLVMQHALYVPLIVSALVRHATVAGGWLVQNVLIVMTLVLLAQVSQLMNVQVPVLEIFSKMQLFLVALLPAQMASTKQLLM